MEFWNTRTAEQAERRTEREEWRQERREAKRLVEAELAASLATWPAGEPKLWALAEEISDTPNFDSDFSSDEEF